MAWKRRRSSRPASPGATLLPLIADDVDGALRPVAHGEVRFVSEEIARVARAAGEDPLELDREVRAFRDALRRTPPLAAVVDAIAISTIPDVEIEHAHPVRHRQRRLVAAAAFLIVAVGSGAAIVAVASPRGADRSHVQAFELTAAQQYGVLAVAVHERSTGQIAAASAALHQSLEPLLAAAPNDPRAAKTAMMLLTNERALLLSASAQTPPAQTPLLTGVLAQSQNLITQLQITAKTPVPPVITIPTVVLPTATPTAPPTSTDSPDPNPTPTPTVSPTPPASPEPTPTPEPTTTPEPTVPVLVPQALGADG